MGSLNEKFTDDPRREFKLPDGRTADIIEPAKGKHLRKASRMTAGLSSPSQFDGIAAMISVRCRIGKENITPEEIDELDEEVVNALAAEVLGQSEGAKAARAARSGKAETSESSNSSPNAT